MTYPIAVLSLCIVLATTANALTRTKLPSSIKGFRIAPLSLSDTPSPPSPSPEVAATPSPTPPTPVSAANDEFGRDEFGSDEELDIDLDQLAKESVSFLKS